MLAFPANNASVSLDVVNVAPVLSNGWGGRIRTSEWRDQNPLPYHLATPQQSCSCKGELFNPRATKLVQRAGTCTAISCAACALAKAAKIQEPVPVRRAGA